MRGTYTPYEAEQKQYVQPPSWQARSMGVKRIMGVVDCRQDAPAPVDLRIVLVDLRYNEEYRCQEQRESKSRDQGVGRDVKDFKSLKIGSVLENMLGKVVQLRQIWLHGLIKVSTIGESLDHW